MARPFILIGHPSLPVHPDQWTSSVRSGWPDSCQILSVSSRHCSQKRARGIRAGSNNWYLSSRICLLNRFATAATNSLLFKRVVPLAPCAIGILFRGREPRRRNLIGRSHADREFGAFRKTSANREDVATGMSRMCRGKRCCHFYSITSSARASNIAGSSRPRALAVLRLMTNSYLIGACTGRSAGFSPLSMRSVYSAARR